MRTSSVSVFTFATAALTAPHAAPTLSASSAPGPDRSDERTDRALGRLKGLLPGLRFQREQVEPRDLIDDPAAPVIRLSRIDDPVVLERRLRELVKAPYANVRLHLPDGRARLGHFSIGSGELIESNLLVIRGKADVYGRVTGNLVTLDGDILVHRGAIIDGNALAMGGTVRNLGGVVSGQSETVDAAIDGAPAPNAVVGTALRLVGVFGAFATLALVGFGLVLFGKSNLEIVSDTVGHSFLRSFLVGLLSQVLLVPTFGMLVVGLVLSVVGVLLVPFVVAVYALLVVAGVLGGFLAVTHAMGETQTRRRLARGAALSPNSYRYLLVGLASVATVWLAWGLFGWVPVAGALVLGAACLTTWLLATVGLGAFVLSRGGVKPSFAGRYLPTEMLTDEYLWATPQQGVPAIQRPPRKPTG